MSSATLTFARSRPVALAAFLILPALARAGAAQPVKPEPPAARPAGLSVLFKGLKIVAPPEGAKVLPRYPVEKRRRVSYAGTVRESTLARSGGKAVVVSRKVYTFRRIDLVEPLDSGIVRVLSYDEQRLDAAEGAGRDSLALYRERPSGGARISAIIRRGVARGLEPAAGDRDLQRVLAPLPEMPRLPVKSLSPGRAVTRLSGQHLVAWELAGAARLGKRACWVLKREVRLKAGAERGAQPVTARSEYLVDAGDFAVLGVVSVWMSLGPGGGLAEEIALELKLVDDRAPGAEDLRQEISRVEQVRSMLRAVAARDVGRVERLLPAARAAKCPRAALALAERYAEAEKAMASATGGRRRINLVPEDTFAFVSAPGKIDPKVKLTPVVFLHGAAARAETYFKDWREKVGDRPMLLVFPQSRSWTWNARSDGAVLGSLIDVLARTYNLDRDRLVLAGHGAGGEMAMLMAYGASFPGCRVRAVCPAGALLAEGLRKQAFEQKPPALLARLRSVDAFLLGGKKDKKIRPEKLRNLASWLRSYNPDGVNLLFSSKTALRYDPEWTPRIIEWIEKLPATRTRPRTRSRTAPGRR